MEQIARNLTDYQDGFLMAKRFLIIDRDALFSPKFKAILECSGIEILLTAYRAPNMNAFAERFVRSIRSECLGQMVFVGQASLDRAIADFVAHYHDERSHQGIDNEIVSGVMPQRLGQVEVSERLGGLLNYYHRRAA
jgi:putative transposase